MKLAILLSILLFSIIGFAQTNVTDPCAGVVCNSPPPSYCINNIHRTYPSTGTCSNGQCTYQYSEETCLFGCSGTACATDFCSTTSCGSTTVTCPDGFQASCQKVCDSSAKKCNECAPSCAAHEETSGSTQPTQIINQTVVVQPILPSCPVVNQIPPICPEGQFIKKNFDSNGCFTGYGCSGEQTQPVQPPGCPAVEIPVCPQGALNKKYDNNGCVISAECASRCPTPPPFLQCDSSERVKTNYDSNGCAIGYYCEKPELCTEVITPAMDAAGNCKHFPTPCDVPPGWKPVHDCPTTTKPICGNARCDIGEDPNNCPQDCSSSTCQSISCPDGRQVRCFQTPNGCGCEQCGPPPGCREVKDLETGFVKIECENIKRQCGEISQDVRLKCTDSGGRPVFGKDQAGCPSFYCDFGSGSQISIASPQQQISFCPPREQVEADMNRCKEFNSEGFVVFEGGCKIARCVHKEKEGQRCGDYERMKKDMVEKCQSQGLAYFRDFDEHGCPTIRCGELNECQREVSKEAAASCEEKGGEFIVKQDERGCIAYSNCVVKGDRSRIYVESVEKVPESTDLLKVAFKLEQLSVELDKLARESDNIAAYYASVNSPEEGRFRRVSDMFEAAKDKVTEIKTKIRDRLNSLTVDDILEIKQDIKYIKDVVIKDIVYVMLSSSDDIKEIVRKPTEARAEKECDDESCFGDAFRICKPGVSFEPDDEGPVITIIGLESGACIVNAVLPEGEGPPPGVVQGINPPYEMTCRFTDYAFGMPGGEPEELEKFCEGNLVTLMKQFEGQRGPPGVPGLCSGDECRRECPKSRENAKKCLEYLGQYLPADAKKGLTAIAEGRFETRRASTEGFQKGEFEGQGQFQPSGQPNSFQPQGNFQPSEFQQGSFQPSIPQQQGGFQQPGGFAPPPVPR